MLKNLLSENGTVVALIKPQFEAGRGKVGKKGVVKDPMIHIEVITNIVNTSCELGFVPIGLTYSPVKGPQGNIEYLIYLANFENEMIINTDIIEQIVKEAHANAV